MNELITYFCYRQKDYRVTSIANKRHSVSDHVFDLIFFCKVLHSRQSSCIEAIFSESGRRE